MKINGNVGCFIFHRDLRIHDNLALIKLCDKCDIVIPIFVFTPSQVVKNKYKSLHSVRFMIECLVDLNDSLKGRLITFQGDLILVLRDILSRIPINYIGFNQDITPFAKARTASIKTFLQDYSSIKLVIEHDYYLCDFNQETLLNDGKPFVKFSAFERRVNDSLKTSPLPVVNKRSAAMVMKKTDYLKYDELSLVKNATMVISLDTAYLTFLSSENKSTDNPNIDLTIESMAFWDGQRKTAIGLLQQLRRGDYKDYKKKRNELLYSTTRLSAFIKYGLVSIREVAWVMLDTNSLDLFRQLLWREFYAVILYHIPRVLNGPFKEKYSSLQWENNATWIDAWQNGKTGFPIVDACMTQLKTTGYMPNRGRLIVSSFLVKLLLVDWRIGERYFATLLVDYDPSNNNGNWQWVAGTGTDSMPYFRIFNPWIQSKKHDPDGEYIKQWLPQLKDVPANHLHQWYDHCSNYVVDTLSYYKPIVDYKVQREGGINMYKRVK